MQARWSGKVEQHGLLWIRINSYLSYMRILISCILFCMGADAVAQSANEVIASVQERQASVRRMSYALVRMDTFVTGTTRRIEGEALLMPSKGNKSFGFLFYARRPDLDREAIYDGKVGYDVKNKAKTYGLFNREEEMEHIFGSPGGQLILPDLARIDTAGAIRTEFSQDGQSYFLTFHYPDIEEYDVRHRCKTLTIDKRRLLPIRLQRHQLSLGKLQHLDYKIVSLKLDEEATAYNFDEKAFLQTHVQEIAAPNKGLLSLKGQEAPPIELLSFDGKPVSLASFKGKVVLLDFWEVWCGPCMASMPKVQDLYAKYKGKGLEVFGIMSEENQVESAKKLIAKVKAEFPMLKGNAATTAAYHLSAVPLYVLIDKSGKVRLVSEGYPEDLEKNISALLME